MMMEIMLKIKTITNIEKYLKRMRMRMRMIDYSQENLYSSR